MSGLFPLWQLDRLRMATDGHGVTALVCSYGCPLNCKYCINPQTHSKDGKFTFVTPEELYEKVKIDNLYYLATNGGIMFGGGEPLLHADFISDFRKIVPSEWNIYCETSLYIPTEQLFKAAEVIDHFYVDIKDSNPEIYKKYTGTDGASLVIQHIALLLRKVGPDKITVRVPLIPDFNTDNDLDKTIELLKKIGIQNFDRFKYKT